MTPHEKDRIECAIRHIQTAVDVDPWAVEIAVEAMQTQLSAEGTTSDLISRQEAIDAECEVCQIAPKKERGHNCTYYVHGCKEIECLRDLPSAHPEIEERKEEYAQNVPKEDLISRKAAIDALGVFTQADALGHTPKQIVEALSSAQPETAKRIVGKSRNGMTLWYQCDMCNEPVDAQDDFCRGCGRRLTDG